MTFCYSHTLRDQISPVLIHHQKDFLLQQIGTSRDLQPDIMHRMRAHEILSLNKSLPSRLMEPYGRGDRKGVLCMYSMATS